MSSALQWAPEYNEHKNQWQQFIVLELAPVYHETFTPRSYSCQKTDQFEVDL